MTVDKLRDVFGFYRQILMERGYAAVEMSAYQYALVDVPQDVLLCHLRWMCETCLTGIDGVPDRRPRPSDVELVRKAIEKAMRWLGYVQGELRALGWYTIADLRAHSRST